MPKTIGDALEWHAKFTPKQVAVVDTAGGSLEYGQLWDRVCRLGNALLGLGIAPGDRVAILMVNGKRYIETYHAIATIGAAAVPLNFRFVASEIEYVVNHSGAKALFFDSAFAPVVKQLDGKLATVGANLVVSDAAPGAAFGALSYEALVEKASSERPAVAVGPESCFFQGYTAGTTGFPKGCVNLHRGFVDFFKRTALLWSITPRDVELVPAPLFHEAPTLFAMTQIFRGGTVVVTKETQPADLLRRIAEHRTTWAFMVPTMWDALVSSNLVRREQVESMRVLVSAGAPLLTHTKEALLEQFPTAGLNEFYGGTEVGIVTNIGPDDQRRKVRSVGRPIPGFHVRLLDESGKDVPHGEVGEIYIRGPILIREYFKNPEATAAARKGEWFTLGDMGQFDEEGYLHIVDRRKDMIITGGEHVFPTELESVFYTHPAVASVAVVGIPDKRWGEVILAAIVLKAGQRASEEELINHCNGRVARFKVPKRIQFMDQLPMSAFGKILRREVRRPYWEGWGTNV
jgi:acyl-CoA synthetase (AMP-forming)/AMP-acid ligase II